MRKRTVAYVFALLLPLTALLVLLVTNVAIKSIRYFLDRQQYGKSYTNVSVDPETERRMRTASGAGERVKIYRQHLETKGRYAGWPSIRNFSNEWTVHRARYKDWSNNYEVHAKTEKDFNGVWYTRDKRLNERKVLFFLHGGATFAGSPYKYNNLHWLETVGWLGGMDERYTDVCSIDYRLQPEYTLHDGLQDCVDGMANVLEEHVDNGRTVAEVSLVGFSAGGTMALQCGLLIESANRTGDDRPASLFGFELKDDARTGRQLRRLTSLWSRIRDDTRLYLISPLCRLDRLFVNEHYDGSHILATFSRAFFERHSDVYDPLFNMVKYRLQLDSFRRIVIVDVCRNSLSNHAIQLDRVLRQWSKDDHAVPSDNRRLLTLILSERELLIDRQLAKKILEYEMKRGMKQHLYIEHIVRNKEWSTAEGQQLAHFVHYHFFMYIVPANASWTMLTAVLKD